MTGMDFIYIAIQTSYKAISIDIHTQKERKKKHGNGITFDINDKEHL